ncbi:MAG: methyltransferase domain-containing protein [Halanaerobiales bacterium]|nr:methyltransferase domain-containing protein [Halanaerobiales bacterium]
MDHKKRCNAGHNLQPRRHRRGPSSYAMHDSELAISELNLKDGDFFLDLGCGPGDYTIQVAKIVGDSGLVYALDIWKEIIDNLIAEVDSYGLKNIEAMIADITCSLPLKDDCIDLCFMATVLHSLNLNEDVKNTLFKEIHRVLKPRGRLAIIEIKKEDTPFGPPKHLRFSPEELEDLLNEYGFEKNILIDLGYTYLIQFITK